MSSFKRKAPSTGHAQSLLQRRVRPRIEPEPESDIEESNSEAPSEGDIGSDGSASEDEEHGGSDSEEDSEADSEAPIGRRDRKSVANEAAQLTFGALAKAQASLGGSGKRRRRGSGSVGTDADDDDDEGEDQKAADHSSGYGHPTREERERKKALLKRSSKHAPVEMTSKKPVSRKRDFVEVPKNQARDPRFMPIGGYGAGAPIDEGKLRRAYSFLDDYQEDEMKQLREAIKKTKDAGEKEKLQRALMAMESRKKARVRKDKERELLEEHRKQEKELVKQGKQPFYLKKSEQKKRLLVDQFAGMKKSQVDKAIEKKRKKIAGKEKKSLPYARRTAEDRV